MFTAGDKVLKYLLFGAFLVNSTLLFSIGYRYSFATSAMFSFEPSQLFAINSRKMLSSIQMATTSDYNENADVLPWIYVVTPTKTKLEQKADLTRLSQTLRHVKNVFWIVIEDATNNSPKVEGVLKRSGVKYVHLATNAKVASGRGMAQRNLGLDWIERSVANGNISGDGLMYFADDDNTYDVRLFDNFIRRVKRVGIWAVGLVGGTKVETPRVSNNKVVGWDVYYAPQRAFATDMAGFAVHVSVLMAKRPRFHRGCGSGNFEPCFVKQLGVPKDQLEPFGHMPDPQTGVKEILVWHTKTGNGGSGGSDKGFEI